MVARNENLLQTPERALDELWRMAWRHRAISPSRLIQLLPDSVDAPRDPRSDLLIHDAMDALEHRFGPGFVESRLGRHPNFGKLQSIWSTRFDKVGFDTLERRLMEPTTPAQIERFFRELGRSVRRPARVYIAGSAVLIVNRIIARQTTDIDVIDEIPAIIREQYDMLDRLQTATQLKLAHTASHYYPKGWQVRSQYYEKFGELEVYMLDPIDLLVGKLFSKRDKDFRDITDAWDQIDQSAFRHRLTHQTRGLRQVPHVQDDAREHWYILTGEKDLPPLDADAE